VPATQQSQARTRAFARVLGPWLAIAPGIIALRAPGMGALASESWLRATVTLDSSRHRYVPIRSPVAQGPPVAFLRAQPPACRPRPAIDG